MRRNSSSLHGQFFTSLKHLEKRLEVEDEPPSLPSHVSPTPSPEPQQIINGTQSTDSLGTPIYLATANTNPQNLQESEIPCQFLSNSPDFSSTPQENQSEAPRLQTTNQSQRFNLDDEIQQLMQLLCFPDSKEFDEETRVKNLGNDDEFLGKIVGVKGPKSGKEADRLEEWINHYVKCGKTEPLRLAHLLLGKAAFVYPEWDDDCDGFKGFEFPSTIQDFLQNDPPSD